MILVPFYRQILSSFRHIQCTVESTFWGGPFGKHGQASWDDLIIHYPHQKRRALHFFGEISSTKKRLIYTSPTGTSAIVSLTSRCKTPKVKVIVAAFGAWPSLPSIKWWPLPLAREAQCRCGCVMGVICIESSFEAWTGKASNDKQDCKPDWGKMAGILGTCFLPSGGGVGAQSTQKIERLRFREHHFLQEGKAILNSYPKTSRWGRSRRGMWWWRG